MKIFCYILVIIGAFLGGFQLFETLLFAESAPQQAAGAALAVAWVALPYCFARAVDKLSEKSLDDALSHYFPRRDSHNAPPTVPAGYVEVAPPPASVGNPLGAPKFHPITGKPLP